MPSRIFDKSKKPPRLGVKSHRAQIMSIVGAYSERFFGADAFAKALGSAVSEFENGNKVVVEDLYLWFLPTSDWDDFVELQGFALGQRVSELLVEYRNKTYQDN